MTNISKAKLVKLQVLWGQYAKREILDGDQRAARLAWAIEQIGRPIDSFKQLSYQEADRLIARLHGFLGVAVARKKVRARTASDALSRGLSGRRGDRSNEVNLASTDDLARIDDAIARLGWNRERFDAWLRSISSPLAKKIKGVRVAPSEPKIRTRAEANRVWWAMKHMLRRAGAWKE